MATTVESLFGVSPEGLNAQRDAALQAQALQFAQLTPAQQAQMGFFMAGNRLGSGLAGMMGAQDPELERIRQRQGLLRGLDLNNPTALRSAAAQALQSGDAAAASLLNTKANEVQKALLERQKTQAEITATEALAEQRRREKEGADPLQQLIRSGKYTPESVAAYVANNYDPASLTLATNEKPTKPDAWKVQEVGVDSATGAAVYTVTEPGKAPFQATQGKDAEGKPTWVPHFGRVDRTTAKISTSAELKMPPDIVGAVNAADKVLEPALNMANSASLAKRLINETAKTNNSQSWEAARTTIAKAVGENKLSNEDIRRTGVDPRLVQGALDWVNKKIQGVPNEDIQKQLYVLASVLEKNAQGRYDAQVLRFRKSAQDTGFKGDVRTYFPLYNERGAVAPTTPAAPGAGGNVVDWNTLNK